MKRIISQIKDGSVKQILKELLWILVYTRKYIWVVVWYIILGIVSTAMSLAASVLSKNIIDIVTGFETGKIVFVSALYVFMQISSILINAFTSRISTRVSLRVNQEIRADIFSKIMNSRWRDLSKFHSGDLLSRSGRDADTVASAVMGWLPSFVINLVQFAGVFFVLMYYDPTLALLALLTAPVTILASGVLLKRVRKHSKQMREIGSEMTIFHSETFQNIQIIKSFGIVDASRKNLENIQRKQREATLDYNKFSIFSSSFLAFVGMIVAGVCFFWSVYRLWGKHITYGEMVLFLQLSGRLSGAFGSLVSLVPSAITAATSAGRIIEITELPEEEFTQLKEVDELLDSSGGAININVSNIDFAYIPDCYVFKNAGLSVESGQIVALVGPSGGGKTTMLKILLGILEVENGRVSVSGGAPECVLEISPSTRKLFSYVPQDNTMFSGTIAENLRVIKPDATDDEIINTLKIACAFDFVTELPDGINTDMGERGSGFSEGQIQRLSIARALLSNAPIILLDEATSALDIKTERELLKNIVEHQKNRTCIVTTHRESVLEICDAVYSIGDAEVKVFDEKEIEEVWRE